MTTTTTNRPSVFGWETHRDPAVRPSLPRGEDVSYGVTCQECGGDIPYSRDRKTTTRYCSPKCRYRARDRARYAADPKRERGRARAYYWANREQVLEKAAARRGRTSPAEVSACSECGQPLEGWQRVSCGTSKCRDARFRRLHPAAYATREQGKAERRRARRRASTEGGEGT